VLNVDKNSEARLKLPISAERYTLSSPDLFSATVLLNGKELKAGDDGTVPPIQGQHANAGVMKFAPLTMTFVAMPSAGNSHCWQ
jgi:heparanase